MPYRYFPIEFSSYEDYVKYLKEKGLAIEETTMTQEDKDYLVWRCKTNWHNKYYHYINEWINNVLPTQLEYFRKEMNNLINRRIYDTRR